MSSDNFYLIRKATQHGTQRWAVTCEFASDHPTDSTLHPQPDINSIAEAIAQLSAPQPLDSDGVTWFDSEQESAAWAAEQTAEYPPVTSEHDWTGDSAQARTRRAAAAVAAIAGPIIASEQHEDRCVLHTAQHTITIAGPDSGPLGDWIHARWMDGDA